LFNTVGVERIGSNYGGFSPEGPLFAGDRAALGFKFKIDGATHFGWADVSMFNTEFYFPFLTLNRIAYESAADTPIHVSPLPEPSSLALLALGATGVWAFRQRRAGSREGVAVK
jgi:hypothetical protein